MVTDLIGSMIEQKFPAVEQRPEYVFKNLVLVFGGRYQRRQSGQLILVRLARERANIELGNPRFDGRLARIELGDQPALLDLRVDRITVEQVEGLRKRGLHLHLARAGGLAGRSAERLQEIS